MASKQEREIRKVILNELEGFFRSNGFSVAKDAIRFYRVVGDGVVQIVLFELVGGGTAIEVMLLFYVEGLLHAGKGLHGIDGSLVVYVGDSLGDDGVGDEFYDDFISTPDGIKSLCAKVADGMERNGFAYLSTIESRAKFWGACDEKTRSRFESTGMRDLILYGP